MLATLSSGLSSRNGLVRKATAAGLRVPKWLGSFGVTAEHLAALPPVLANSVPKSGTHLLAQVVEGLPERVNYGAFLASMTSSFRFRERTRQSVSRFIASIVPGEIVRGHLFYDVQGEAELAARNVVHYFIYRDPRDVVVSEAHYLREMNRWHRLHRHFAGLASLDDAIALSITGFDPPLAGTDYPNIAERFSRYCGWLDSEDCLAIRFEDLRSAEQQPALIRQLADFYARRCDRTVDVDECAQRMTACIAPEKSHTFRSGKRAGWKRVFTPEHYRLFDQFAGQLLIDLGYEPNQDWVTVSSTI